MGIYFLPAAPRELAPIAVPKLLVPIVLLVALMPYPMTLPLQPTYTCIGTQVWTAERIVSFPPALQPYYASLHGCGLGAILQLKWWHILQLMTQGMCNVPEMSVLRSVTGAQA